MTANNAVFADQVIRAGNNAGKIVESYLKNTPKIERSAEELSQLLMRPDIDLGKIPEIPIEQQAAMKALSTRAKIETARATNQEENTDE